MTTPAPAPAPGAAPVSDGKTLGIVGLVLAFVAPLIGLIVSIIARNQSKAAGVENTPAKVGLILSIIFLILGTIFLILYFAFFATMFAAGGLISIIGIIITAIIVGLSIAGAVALLGACAEAGPGIHTLDNGGTLTCG